MINVTELSPDSFCLCFQCGYSNFKVEMIRKQKVSNYCHIARCTSDLFFSEQLVSLGVVNVQLEAKKGTPQIKVCKSEVWW